jgi:hypothetical protein
VKVDDGKGNAATAPVTITLNQVKEMDGVTIRMRGKSLKSTTAVAGYILQGGSDGVGGLVGGLVEEAAEELLKNAQGGDVTLLTTGDGSKLWGALWTHSANVTPQEL